MTPALILASTSRYRRDLLARLRLDFEVARPEVDESALPGETPSVLARRLATAKAAAIAVQAPHAWVIGSDQVADLDGRALGKSGGRDAAIAQLQGMSGRPVAFRTAVCVMRGATSFDALDTTLVHFRNLDHAEIERYVDAEQPFDCAGSFKSEGLGIALFEAIETQDPTALIGLPLIATARLVAPGGLRVALRATSFTKRQMNQSTMRTGCSGHSSTLPSRPCKRRPSQCRPGATSPAFTCALKPTSGWFGSVEIFQKSAARGFGEP